MSKFVSFIFLILTLIAVSTAKWTITLPPTADAGQTIQVLFKSDAAVVPSDVSFAFTPDLLTDKFLVGMGGGACALSPANTLIPYSLQSDSVGFTFLSDLVANSQITCTFRIHYAISPATEYFVSIGNQAQPDYSKSTLALNSLTLAATASSSSAKETYVEVSFKLTGLPKSTVIGPASFLYRADQKDDVTVDDSVFASINHKDGVVIFGNIRLVYTDDSRFYFMTNDATTGEETIVVQFPIISLSADTTSYSATLDIEKYFKQDKSGSLTAQTTITLPIENSFQSSMSTSVRDNVTWVYFSYDVQYSPVDAAEITFTIDGYTPEVIFGQSSSLVYFVDGSGTNVLDTGEKKFTYKLPKVVKNKRITLDGSFTLANTDDIVLGKVKFSITGAPQADSSAEMGIYISQVNYKMQSSTDEQLVFQVTVQLGPSYATWKEVVPFAEALLNISYGLSVDSKSVRSEIRKQGEFLPSCTVDDNKKNVSVRSTNAVGQGVRGAIVSIAVQGEFANGADIVGFTCVQALNKGKKASKNISIGGDDSFTAAWSTVDPVDFDQIIHVFTESPITNSVDFNALVTQVVTELVKVDQFSELTVANFPYVWFPTMPQVGYGAGIARKFQFDTAATAWTTTSAHYEFGINRKDSKTQPIYQVITLPTFTIIIDPDQASALPASYVWLDANDDTVYDTTQMVQQVNTCWSSQQCAADYYCVDSTCTSWALLTLEQQAIIQSPDYTSQGNTGPVAVSVIAMLIAFIACFF